MADKFNVTLVGADQLIAQLTFAAGQLDRPLELMQAIGATLEANVERRYDLKQDAAGNAWAPLKESTLQAYRAKYPSGIPGSLLERHVPGMRSSLSANAGDTFVEVGFSVPYAGYHVTGTRFMARRDPLFGVVDAQAQQGELGAEDMRDIEEVVERFLGGLLS